MRLGTMRRRAGIPRRRQLANLAVSLLCVGGTVLAVETTSARPASASIGGDKSRIAQIEREIYQEGNTVEALVSRADQVQGQLNTVDERIAVAKAQLATEQKAYSVSSAELAQDALDAYVSDGSNASAFIGGSSDATTSAEQQVYAGVEAGSLSDAMNTTELAERALTSTETALHADEVSLQSTLTQLASARQSAEAAIQSDEELLSQVKGNLLHLVLQQEEQQREAAEAAQEAKEAQEAKQAQPPPPPPPPPVVTPPPTTTTTPPSSSTPTPPPPPPVSGGSYANPLRGVSGLSPERIDMGVDYSGYGPIYAIGDGVVVNTVNGGWPGGTFIVYQLTNGPGAGLFVYAAEDINPEVSVGQSVTPNTVLGQIYEGPDGIETGWADGSALGDTMAAVAGQFDGDNSTAFGYNFSQLLSSLGAPGGILENDPATGSLPAGWPQW
jgi:murein DD-endopeptidase MepM/ murein hydrolase activator NlpD